MGKCFRNNSHTHTHTFKVASCNEYFIIKSLLLLPIFSGSPKKEINQNNNNKVIVGSHLTFLRVSIWVNRQL